MTPSRVAYVLVIIAPNCNVRNMEIYIYIHIYMTKRFQRCTNGTTIKYEPSMLLTYARLYYI